jgi:pimeloyl-ACP methyl ester carboxylesterase
MTVSLPHFALNSLGEDDLRRLDGKSFVVTDDSGVDLPCRLKMLPGANVLFVMFHAAFDRTKVPLPVFARWNYGRVLGGHVLAVSDPTLALDDRLRLGWYVGSRGADPMHILLRAVDRVRQLLGLADDHVVFYGSSGGGFAAMRAAASRRCGRAVVINPQTEITAYFERAVTRFAKVFAPELTAQESRDRYPLRWSAIAAIADARLQQRDLRIVYAQNLDDKVHHARHFRPFCGSTNAPVEGGASADGSVLTHVYASPEGHGAEPPEVVKYLATEGMKHLLRGTPVHT